MLPGTGLAFYLGKPLIEPSATIPPSTDLGWWSGAPQVRPVLKINVLFIIGAALASLLVWVLGTTRWGLNLPHGRRERRCGISTRVIPACCTTNSR
jgi:general nucleoside transport system permease protein